HSRDVSKFSLCLTQGLLRALALSDVSYQSQAEPITAVPKWADANLDREQGPILSPMRGLEGEDLSGIESLLHPLDKHVVHAAPGIEVTRRHPDQFLTSVAEALAGLSVHVNNLSRVIVHKQRIGRMIHIRPESGLRGAQLFFGALAFGNVLHCPEHSTRPPRFIPGHIGLTMDDAHLAVRPDHAKFGVIAWTAPQRSRHRFEHHWSIFAVDQLLNPVKSEKPFLLGHCKNPVCLVRPGDEIRIHVAVPVSHMRKALGLFQLALAFAQIPKTQ